MGSGPNRIATLDIARAIAIILVVLLHASLLPQFDGRFTQPVARMALLLFLGGSLAIRAQASSYTYSRERSLDMLWLYVVWSPVILFAQGGLVHLNSLPNELISPSSHLWYIALLALLMWCTWLLQDIKPMISLIMAGIAAIWYWYGGRCGLILLDQAAHFSIFFFLGLHYGYRIISMLEKVGRRAAIIAGFLFVALLSAPLPHSIVTVGSAFLLLPMARGLSGGRIGAALGWLGRRTSEIYVAHVPILIVIGRTIGPFDTLLLVGLTAVTIGLCLGLRRAARCRLLDWHYRRPAWARASAWAGPMVMSFGVL